MRSSGRLSLVAVLIAALAVAVPSAARGTPSAANPAATSSAVAAVPTGPRHTVTLVTGDKIAYTGTGAALRVVGITPPRTRRAVTYVTVTQGGDRYVYPSDAWRGLGTGTLDKRLFDVSLLVRDGYDDAHRSDVGVIVTGLAPMVATPRGTLATALPGAQLLRVAKPRATALWTTLENSGRTVWLDGRVRASLDQSVPLIGAPQAWKAGWTGKGVKVAVLDTGIDTQHPDLRGKVVLAKDFSGTGSTDDRFGHGTHVASILTGTGAASGGRYKGVAPGVKLLNGKVLDDQGFGSDSSIMAGMQWAVTHGAKIVSMSLGGGPSDGTDLLSRTVDQLSRSSGALFVIAAGNFGGAETVSSPAAANAALAVASTTKQDALSSFSSQGPRVGNFGLKPDIAAPGSDIVAARAPGVFPDAAVDKYYVKLSGTSMATPHVAGAAAILAQEHPSWTGVQLKAALMDSAKQLSGIGVFADGAGRVDVAAAVFDTVHATTPDAGFGILSGAASQAVRYANDGTKPVTLHLTLRTADQRGTASPAGLFTTSARTLTVPAHGQATVTVAAHPAAARPGGYAGRLVATYGTTTLATPVGGEIAAPTHSVTVRVLDRRGHRPGPFDAEVALQNERTGDIVFLPDFDTGSFTADVPDGTYRAVGVVLGHPAPIDDDEVTLFVRGPITVRADRTLTIDTRGAQPRRVTTDVPGVSEDRFDSLFAVLSDVHGTTVADSEAGVQTNLAHQYTSVPVDRPGVRLAYLGIWERPLDVATTTGPDPYAVGDIVDNTPAMWRGDVTGRLVDIGQRVDPSSLPDVRGKVVLEGGPTNGDGGDPPSDAQLVTLAKTLKQRGALVLLANDYVADTSFVPVLQLFDLDDIQSLRDRLAAGPVTMHVVGQPLTPHVLTLFRTATGAFPHGFAPTFRRADLARIDQTFREPQTAPHYSYAQLGLVDAATGVRAGGEYQTVSPAQRVDYVTAGVAWSTLTGVGSPDDPDLPESADEIALAHVYAAGSHTAQVWGTAPFGPSLPLVPASSDDGKPLPWAYRQGDKVYTAIPVFDSPDPAHLLLDSALVFGGTPHDAGSTVLYRNGAVVDSSDVPGTAGFTLPAAPASYRLVVDGTRTEAGWLLSPHVHAVWTFRSGHTAAAARSALPLLSVRLALPLDGRDRLTGRAATALVDRQQGSGTARVTALDVYVSYGGQYRRAAVTGGSGGRFAVTLPAVPSGARYASLLLHARDADGNDVIVTIDRAAAV